MQLVPITAKVATEFPTLGQGITNMTLCEFVSDLWQADVLSH